jgi:hypothetical protein
VAGKVLRAEISLGLENGMTLYAAIRPPHHQPAAQQLAGDRIGPTGKECRWQ